MKRLALLLPLLLAAPLAAANPFTSGAPARPPAALQALPQMPYLHEILAIQRHIHEAMTAQLQALRDGARLAPLWLLLAVSFAYGVFHVLAPGHGKAIVGSWFIGNRARWRDAVGAGLIMAVGHTVTAVAIVTILYLALGMGQLQVLANARIVELIGYGAIAAIGLWLLVRKAFNAPACCHCGHHHHHGQHHHHAHDHAQPPLALAQNRQALSLFAATSLVPCTGSMIILLFTLANQILWAGILAVIAIALGMWLTLTAIALATIVLHRSLTGAAAPRPWQQKLHHALGYAAALLVLLVGITLFTGTLLTLQSG